MRKLCFMLTMIIITAAIGAGSVAFAAADFTVTVSSTLADDSFVSTNLTDGDSSTQWYSQWADEKNPVCNEWILLDFGSVRRVESITLMPNEHRICFPSDFVISWGTSGEVWIEVEGFSFTDYQIAASGAERFNINTVTRYVRISVSKRNHNPDGNYLVSFAEISAETRNATAAEVSAAERADADAERIPVVSDPVISSTATASSSNIPEKDWGVANINDGLLATQWCAEWGSNVDEESCDEWVLLTFAAPQYVKGIILNSQLSQHYGFPKNFSVSWTLDGEHFFPISGAEYTDEPTDNTVHVKAFDTPVTATAIRINITASYGDMSDNYLPQMAELQAHGRQATDAEVTAATTLFNSLVGSNITETDTNFSSNTGCYTTGAAVMLAAAIVLLGAAACILIIPTKGKGGKNE